MFDNYIAIGRNFMTEKNYLKALKFFKKAFNCPEGKDDIDLILDLAFLYDKIAHFDLAEKMYRRVLELDETNAIAYYGLGIIYDDDELYEDAKAFVIQQQSASTSLLQRRFRIGYNRAARLIDDVQQQGIITPPDGAKPRKVLVNPPEEQE